MRTSAAHSFYLALTILATNLKILYISDPNDRNDQKARQISAADLEVSMKSRTAHIVYSYLHHLRLNGLEAPCPPSQFDLANNS